MIGESDSEEQAAKLSEARRLLARATCRLIAAGFGDEQLTKDLINYIRRCGNVGSVTEGRRDSGA